MCNRNGQPPATPTWGQGSGGGEPPEVTHRLAQEQLKVTKRTQSQEANASNAHLHMANVIITS